MITMRTMSIIGFVIAGLTLIIAFAYVGSDTYEWADSAVGWGMILSLYVIAQNIVTIVQTKKNN